MLGIDRKLVKRRPTLSRGDWARIYSMAGLRDARDTGSSREELARIGAERSAQLNAAWHERRQQGSARVSP